MSAAGPSQGANGAPAGGSAAAKPQAWGDQTWQATALDARDNVAIMLEPVAAGQDVVVNLGGSTTTLTAVEPIALGHKIALVDLRCGDALTKYGECIGEATTNIARGAWVHTHNLRSRRARHGDAATSAFDSHAYIDAAAAALELRIPSASREAVAANLMRLHALACEVLAFDTPQQPAGPDTPRQARKAMIMRKAPIERTDE